MRQSSDPGLRGGLGCRISDVASCRLCGSRARHDEIRAPRCHQGIAERHRRRAHCAKYSGGDRLPGIEGTDVDGRGPLPTTDEVYDGIDAAMSGEYIPAEAFDIHDVDQIHHRGFPTDGLGCTGSQRRVAINNDDEVILAELPRDGAASHPGTEHDGNRPAHAATPVIPRAESIAGASAVRSDS